jgi:hypothetical protein
MLQLLLSPDVVHCIFSADREFQYRTNFTLFTQHRLG